MRHFQLTYSVRTFLQKPRILSKRTGITVIAALAVSVTTQPIQSVGAEHEQGTDAVYHLLSERKAKDALNLINGMLEKRPKDKSLLLLRGEILTKYLIRPAEALNDLNKAIALDPKYYDAYRVRGEIYTRLDKFAQAKVDLEKCISLEPRKGDGYLARAEWLAKQSHYKEALEDLKRAEKFQVNDQRRYHQLSAALQMWLRKD
ncbi:MAG: hypothetical protein K2W95_21350 [Candidatus Obscuribacterales bacterium]|nr:hypothetical protein [Candidatus Obscuribacterales bacterium]